MRSILTLLFSSAFASSPTPLHVAAEVRGASASWLVPDLRAGELLHEQFQLSRRRFAEVTMTCRMTEAGDADLDFTVHVVRNPIFGSQQRELVGAPTITLADAEPARMLAGVNVPFTNKGFNHARGRAEAVLRVAPAPQESPAQ